MLTPNVNLKGATVLVTGAAGFIGCYLVKELLNTIDNINIVGFDSVNDYYDVSIKEFRLNEISKIASEKKSLARNCVRPKPISNIPQTT